MDMLMKCSVCNQTLAWHEHHHPVHKFTTAGGALELETADNHRGHEQPSSDSPAQRTLQGDPVLRLVLIQKGVISTDDLTATEAMLLATGAIVTRPGGSIEPMEAPSELRSMVDAGESGVRGFPDGAVEAQQRLQGLGG